MNPELLTKSMSDFCRTCMSPDSVLNSVFSTVNISGKVNKKESIASILSQSISVPVQPSDGLPQNICNTCLNKLLSCYLFQITAHETQLKLQTLKQLQNQENLKAENPDADEQENFYISDEENNEKSEVYFIPDNCHQADDVPMEEQSLVGNNESLNINTKNGENDSDNTGDKTETTQNSVYECKFCSKTYTDKYRLNRHIKIHGDFDELKCHICEKRFAGVTDKDRHLRVHTGERPFSCEYCDKSYRQTGTLYAHLKKVHNIMPKKKTIEEREDSWKWSYLCTVCGNRYTTRNSVDTHMKIKHPEEYLATRKNS